MPIIRPATDLETCLPEITRTVHENKEPVFLTSNGYGDMVVMSMDNWEEMNFENELYQKLLEAQTEARSSSRRLSHKDVFTPLRAMIRDYSGSANNA